MLSFVKQLVKADMGDNKEIQFNSIQLKKTNFYMNTQNPFFVKEIKHN